MNERHKNAHMRVAHVYAALSYAQRRKVGCVIVKDETIIAIGYNGTPPGWNNRCETPDGSATLPEVIHAEQNALDKLVRSSTSSIDSDVFVTTAPCIECAKRLLGARIKSVYYADVYSSTQGLDLLKKAGIYTERIENAERNLSDTDHQCN